MSDKYEYGEFSEKSKEVMRTELHENMAEVNAHIESFRRWILSMPHLKCPTNSNFLIKFLRVSKFDHQKAEMRLDNYCTMRSSVRGSPELFNFFKYDDPVVVKVLGLGQQIPLGKNDAGELVLLIRPKGWNIDEIPFQKWIKVFFMNIDCMITDESSQIHGIMQIIDLKDVAKKAMDAWGDQKNTKQVMRLMQDTLPLRMKAQIFYNEPLIFDIVFELLSFFMKEKMRNRCIRVKHDIGKAIEKVPGLERILPTEYGGQGGPVDVLASKWRVKFTEYFRNGDPMAGIEVDESKRPKETVNYLKEYTEYKGVTLGAPGTYTKYDNVY